MTEPLNIQPILDFALNYNPNLCTADIGTGYMWLNAGCDMELDIMPVMRESIKKPRKEKIRTFSYWTTPIMASRDKRLMQKEIDEAKSKPIDPDIRAKRLQWKLKMDYIISVEDQEFLDSYCKIQNESA